MDRLADLVRASRSVVMLTGAGCSTASGIPDFRTPGTGLWATVDPAEVASIDAFRRDPVRFWSFYSARLGSLASAEPNAGHVAIARMEQLGYLDGLITQNIDRLHRRAGSVAVAEVHGSIDHADCLVCGARHPYERLVRSLAGIERARAAAAEAARGQNDDSRDDGADQGAVVPYPVCDCGAPLKPGVILFGEQLPEAELERAGCWAENADLMIVAGSSLQVWPVAGLPGLTLSAGGRLAIVTLSETDYDSAATLVERAPTEEALPALVARLEEFGPRRAE